MTEAIGFIGLGKLGLPIAEQLTAAGYALRVYNRTAEKAAPLIARGATAVNSAVETAVAGGMVLSVVADDRRCSNWPATISARHSRQAYIFR